VVRIRLSFDRSIVRLEIEDNGCGFESDSTCLAESGHFGILGMRERMDQIGCSLEIESSPGNGTKVAATLPLEQVVAKNNA
jgi:signal transduction histidine kinase